MCVCVSVLMCVGHSSHMGYHVQVCVCCLLVLRARAYYVCVCVSVLMCVGHSNDMWYHVQVCVAY